MSSGGRSGLALMTALISSLKMLNSWMLLGDAGAVLAGGEGRESVDEGGDDVLDIHRGLELSTGFKETGEAGEMELIRKHLEDKDSIRE